MDKVFPEAWYNDVPLSTAKEETGFVLGYNKLVGGLLISQARGLIKPECKKPYYPTYKSAYEDFYPTCFVDTDIAEFVTKEERRNFSKPGSRIHPTQKWLPNAQEPGWLTLVPWTLQTVKKNSTNEVVELDPTPPRWVNDTRADLTMADYYKAFTYTMPSNTRPPTMGFWSEATHGKKEPQESDGGFRVFFKLSDGVTFNRKKLAFLKKNLWLDKFTRRVNIKFAVYNGMLSMFTYVNIGFGYSNSGAFLPFNTKGGTMVEIKSVNMEPYRLTKRSNCTSQWTQTKNESCYKKLGEGADMEMLKQCQPCEGRTIDEVQLA